MTSLRTSPCEFFKVGSKESDDEEARNELRQMREEQQMGKHLAEQQGMEQEQEITQLRSQLVE
eukprot:15819538-Heterocapsa_arctica.AAC.1